MSLTPEPERAERIAQLRSVVERTRPVSLAEERLLPTLPALEGLLGEGPSAGLRRGSVVGVVGQSGATALALALAAGPTRAGSWAAFVGLPELGWSAAAEMGVEMTRVVAVRPDGASGATVLAALVDDVDVVVCGAEGVSRTEARRLGARIRERGSVLVVLAGTRGGVGRAGRIWPEPVDAELTVVDAVWHGLSDGAGHLRERTVTVEVGGRRGLDRGRRVQVLLPDRGGRATAVGGAAVEGTVKANTGARVTPLRRVG